MRMLKTSHPCGYLKVDLRNWSTACVCSEVSAILRSGRPVQGKRCQTSSTREWTTVCKTYHRWHTRAQHVATDSQKTERIATAALKRFLSSPVWLYIREKYYFNLITSTAPFSKWSLEAERQSKIVIHWGSLVEIWRIREGEILKIYMFQHL